MPELIQPSSVKYDHSKTKKTAPWSTTNPEREAILESADYHIEMSEDLIDSLMSAGRVVTFEAEGKTFAFVLGQF